MSEMVTHTFRGQDRPFYVVLPKGEPDRPRYVLDADATRATGFMVTQLDQKRGIVRIDVHGESVPFHVQPRHLAKYRTLLVGCYVETNGDAIRLPAVVRLNWNRMTAETISSHGWFGAAEPS